MDYRKAWTCSNVLAGLAIFTVMLGGAFAHRSQVLFWTIVGAALVMAVVSFGLHFKWCRCPYCGDRLRVTDWMMRLPKVCPKCHKDLDEKGREESK